MAGQLSGVTVIPLNPSYKKCEVLLTVSLRLRLPLRLQEPSLNIHRSVKLDLDDFGKN